MCACISLVKAFIHSNLTAFTDEPVYLLSSSIVATHRAAFASVCQLLSRCQSCLMRSHDTDIVHQIRTWHNGLRCCRKALELDRRNVDAWVARGAAHANKHLFDKAIADFETALSAAFCLAFFASSLHFACMTRCTLCFAISNRRPILAALNSIYASQLVLGRTYLSSKVWQ